MKRLFISLLLASCMFIYADKVSAATTLDCNTLLRYGSRSEQVKRLQTELNEVMDCNLAVDGIFGNGTKSCVLAFQKKYSLSQDAIVGPKTCNKLNSLYLNSNNDDVVDTDNNTSGLYLNTTTTLLKGSNGTYVRVLQEMLNKTTHCNLEIDGNFGYKTEWCVRKYQEENNLGIDGKVGPMTRQSLNANIQNIDNSRYVIINTSSNSTLNVRQDAGTNYADIGDVYTSEIYKIHGSKLVGGTTWYKIEYEYGRYGYISGDYATQNFILLDISSQNIKLYRDGQVVFNVPTVTGNKSKGYDTPLGVYSVGNKLSYKTMGGRIHLSKYDAYVDYWIPFIGGSYGFHDADWRTSSQITNKYTYLTNGSHGCVNMILEDAKYLYDNVYNGLAVHIVD